MSNSPISDRRRRQNRAAQRNHRNNVKNKIESLEETNRYLMELVFQSRKSALGSEPTTSAQSPNQENLVIGTRDENFLRVQTAIIRAEGADLVQGIKSLGNCGQLPEQEKDVSMEIPESTASHSEIFKKSIEISSHYEVEDSNTFPQILSENISSAWPISECRTSRNGVYPEPSRWEVTRSDRMPRAEDTPRPMQTDPTWMDMILDSSPNQPQSNTSSIEELDGTTSKNSFEKNRQPPIFLAIANAHLKIVEFLITHGADPNLGDGNGRTPLHACVECADSAMVKLLLKHGAKTDIEDRYGITPLQLAASSGVLEVVEELIKHGAQVN